MFVFNGALDLTRIGSETLTLKAPARGWLGGGLAKWQERKRFPRPFEFYSERDLTRAAPSSWYTKAVFRIVRRSLAGISYRSDRRVGGSPWFTSRRSDSIKVIYGSRRFRPDGGTRSVSYCALRDARAQNAGCRAAKLDPSIPPARAQLKPS